MGYFNPLTSTRREIEGKISQLESRIRWYNLILASRGAEDKVVYGWDNGEFTFPTLDEAVREIKLAYPNDPDVHYRVERYYA